MSSPARWPVRRQTGGQPSRAQQDLRLRGSVAEGKLWRAICDEAEKLDAEPIVVGARGLSRVQSAFLGSVSSAVVVHAHRPVLVIPGR